MAIAGCRLGEIGCLRFSICSLQFALRNFLLLLRALRVRCGLFLLPAAFECGLAVGQEIELDQFLLGGVEGAVGERVGDFF